MQEIEKDKIYNIDCLEFLNSIKFSGGGGEWAFRCSDYRSTLRHKFCKQPPQREV